MRNFLVTLLIFSVHFGSGSDRKSKRDYDRTSLIGLAWTVGLFNPPRDDCSVTRIIATNIEDGFSTMETFSKDSSSRSKSYLLREDIATTHQISFQALSSSCNIYVFFKPCFPTSNPFPSISQECTLPIVKFGLSGQVQVTGLKSLDCTLKYNPALGSISIIRDSDSGDCQWKFSYKKL